MASEVRGPISHPTLAHHELQQQPSTSTPEYQTLRSCYQLLVSSIRLIAADLCDFLFSANLVTSPVLEHVGNSSSVPSDKARKVLDAILDSVAREPSNYHRFLTVLKESGLLSRDVVEKLEKVYKKECSQSQPARSEKSFVNSLPSSSRHRHGSNFVKVYFVSSLPAFTIEFKLKKHFSQFRGKIDEIKIDKSTGEVEGSIFFPDQKSTEAAVRHNIMNGSFWENKYPMRVELVEGKSLQPSPSQTPHSVTSPSQTSHSGPSPSQTLPRKSSPGFQYEQFTVKLTRLHPSLTQQDLSNVLSQFGPLHQPPKIFETNNRYALANFKFRCNAISAVRGLNQRTLCGQKITVSMKNGQLIPSSTSPEPLIDSLERLIEALNEQYHTTTKQTSKSAGQIPSNPSFTVKLTCLPPSCTQKDLGDLLKDCGELHQPPRVFDEKNRYALANFTTLEGAQNAVTSLNKSKLSGYTINVRRKEMGRSNKTPPRCHFTAPTNTGPMSVPTQPLNTSPPGTNSFPSSPQPHHMASLTMQRSASYPGIPYPHPPPHSFGTPAPQSQTTQQTLKLLPADWSQLMAVGKSGRVLFQEIVEPYQTNPNIEITTDMDSLSVWFSGHPDAVSSAYKRVCAEVQRE